MSKAVVTMAAGSAGADPRRTITSREGRSPRVFDALARAAVNVAVWRRRVPLRHREPLERWVRRLTPSLESEGRGDELPLVEWVASIEDEPTRAWLLADMQRLIALVEARVPGAGLRVCLPTVTGDLCRKFHMDYIRLRLVTTYVGPGTEWVPDADVDREALAHPPECPEQANRRIVPRGDAIRRLAAGDVLLMKGARYGPGSRGAVHRSPPIGGTGQTRLVLSITVP